MKELLAVLTPIALINSLWILPSGIVGVAASLGARRPILTAIAFIAGQFIPHFSFGLLLATSHVSWRLIRTEILPDRSSAQPPGQAG